MLEESLLTFALMGSGWVLWLLVGLSVLCLAVTLERSIFNSLNRTPKQALRASLSDFTRENDVHRLRDSLADVRGAEARVLLSGLQAAELGVSSVEEAMTASLTRERLRMERGLVILGTTGANAPFLGLFGTVLGIIKAFHDLAQNQAEAASAVMAGISEALVATAIGLMVAIPAVVLYNAFQRYNKSTLSRIEALAHILLAHLKGQRTPLTTQDADPAPAVGE